MKLSIVIPAYNEEKYLPLCLESVLAELKKTPHAQDVEVIVVNNASSDNTGQVAASFAGVKVVNESRKGLVAARSAGYLASAGELIANIDADTKLPAGWIDKVFAEFARDEKLVALSGPYVYYDASKFDRMLVVLWYRLGEVTHFINQYLLKKGAMLQGGNFIVRRTALEQIGGFDTSIEFWGEDTDIARRISKVGKVKFTFQLPMYTSARRFSAEGILVAGWKYFINHFWVIFFKKPFSREYRDIRK